MAEPVDFLVVALSARALAVAARRAGCRVAALDLFGDVDTRANAVASEVVDGDPLRGFDAGSLLAAAELLAPVDEHPWQGLVVGAGFEDRPALLERLACGRRLCGNTPETVARTKDPREFFALLDRLRIPHPDVCLSAPREPEGWLAKRAGGSGGGHVAPASTTGTQAGQHFWQRRVAGRAVGVSFLADGERACLLGFSEQWASPTVQSPFRFGGMLQPAALEADVADRLRALLDPLVRALRLVGLNSLDALVDGTDFNVIEVNPRPGANLDVFDRGDVPGLFAAHVRACAGQLPVSSQPAPRASTMSVVYANAATRVPAAVDWPGWVADRPAPRSIVTAGAPLCTVLATHATAQDARRLVETRVTALRRLLRAAADSDDPQRGRMPRYARAPHSDTNVEFAPTGGATRPGSAA